MAIVTSDTAASVLLRRFRGAVTRAGLTYPERAALDVVDSAGGIWHLTTWDAAYLPADPGALVGKRIVGANLEEESGVLTVDFSDGTVFTATPIVDGDEDIKNWQLFTPEELVLTYGPDGRWQLSKGSDPC